MEIIIILICIICCLINVYNNKKLNKKKIHEMSVCYVMQQEFMLEKFKRGDFVNVENTSPEIMNKWLSSKSKEEMKNIINKINKNQNKK